MENLNIKPILEASYLNQKEASNTLQKLGYLYDNQLSTNENKVFVDKEGNPHIAFRGSKRLTDFIIDDPLSVLGLEGFSRRFNDAKELTKKVEEKYNRAPDVYGNSLGGRLAEASNTSGKIITHNKLTGFSDIGKVIPKNQTDLRSATDPASLLSLTQQHKGKFINFKPRFSLFEEHLPSAIPNKPRWIR